MVVKKEKRIYRHGSTVDQPIHQHFGLSYATHLVLPRSVLQSMPVRWQKRFVACLEELDACYYLDKLLPEDALLRVEVIKQKQLYPEGQREINKLERKAAKDERFTWIEHDEHREEFYETTKLRDPLLDYERGTRRIEPTDKSAYKEVEAMK